MPLVKDLTRFILKRRLAPDYKLISADFIRSAPDGIVGALLLSQRGSNPKGLRPYRIRAYSSFVIPAEPARLRREPESMSFPHLALIRLSSSANHSPIAFDISPKMCYNTFVRGKLKLS